MHTCGHKTKYFECMWKIPPYPSRKFQHVHFIFPTTQNSGKYCMSVIDSAFNINSVTWSPDSFAQQLELIGSISGNSVVQQQHSVSVSNWLWPQHWWWHDFLVRILFLWFRPQHNCLPISKGSVENIRMIYHITFTSAITQLTGFYFFF